MFVIPYRNDQLPCDVQFPFDPKGKRQLLSRISTVASKVGFPRENGDFGEGLIRVILES